MSDKDAAASFFLTKIDCHVMFYKTDDKGKELFDRNLENVWLVEKHNTTKRSAPFRDFLKKVGKYVAGVNRLKWNFSIKVEPRFKASLKDAFFIGRERDETL